MDSEASPAPCLVVESGLHAGASSPIPLGETRVGSAFEAEIGVSDLPDPVGFRIQRSRRSITLQAAGSDLAFGSKRLRSGKTRLCDASTSFRSGGVQFHLSMPELDACGAAAARSGSGMLR